MFSRQSGSSVLDAAAGHGIFLLDRIERVCGDIGLEVGFRDVAGTDGADLALLLELDKGVHGFGDWGRRVLPMGDVVIDVIGAETAEALLDLVKNGVAAEIAVHGLAVIIEEMMALGGVPDEAAFGGEHDLVAAALDGAADQLFGKTLAIGGGGVDQGYAGIDGGLDGGDGFGFFRAAHIQPPMAQVPRPMAEALMPEAPIWRAFASGDILLTFHLVEHAGRGFFVEHERIEIVTAEGRADRQHLFSAGRDADDFRASGEIGRRQGHEA